MRLQMSAGADASAPRASLRSRRERWSRGQDPEGPERRKSRKKHGVKRRRRVPEEDLVVQPCKAPTAATASVLPPQRPSGKSRAAGCDAEAALLLQMAPAHGRRHRGAAGAHSTARLRLSALICLRFHQLLLSHPWRSHRSPLARGREREEETCCRRRAEKLQGRSARMEREGRRGCCRHLSALGEEESKEKRNAGRAVAH
jgi:hypothetical protein